SHGRAAWHTRPTTRPPALPPGDRYRIFAITCPFHGNGQWRELRDNSPEEWDDVVAFDAAIRAGNARANAGGNPLLGQAFLHRSRVPLDQAPIDRVSSREWAGRQVDALQLLDEEEPGGCSPWACRGDAP
ncbi:hypothetical protein ABH932_004542, partial [Streptacidiphilus sp. MAP5-52]